MFDGLQRSMARTDTAKLQYCLESAHQKDKAIAVVLSQITSVGNQNNADSQADQKQQRRLHGKAQVLSQASVQLQLGNAASSALLSLIPLTLKGCAGEGTWLLSPSSWGGNSRGG